MLLRQEFHERIVTMMSIRVEVNYLPRKLISKVFDNAFRIRVIFQAEYRPTNPILKVMGTLVTMM